MTRLTNRALRRKAAFAAGQAAGSGAPYNPPPRSSFRARRLYNAGFNMGAMLEGLLSRDIL